MVKKPTENPTKKTPIDPELLQARLRRLALWGLLADFDRVASEEWLKWVIEVEEAERARRSLQRRIKYARLGNFRPMVDFDWSWPRKIDRELLTELFTTTFVEEGVNVILLGPNGVGKTMVAKNLAHEVVVRGHTVRFTTASDMLNDLAAQDSDHSFARRLRRYCWPNLLCIDEVGYLSYDARYADLLFEVVTRRYNDQRAIILTTNKPFGEWPDVFPNAGCVVTLVDRLIHRSEVVTLEGDSYRLHEAKQRAAAREKKRKGKRSASATKPKPRENTR